MYGKAFETMYEGSMIGAGLNVFSVWNYCIAKNRSGVIELNPKLLAFILGAKEAEIVTAIEWLCAVDPKSRSKEQGGRRLVKEGEYQYRMVNWIHYDALRSADDLREYNRRKQAEWRAREKAKKSKGNNLLPGERAAVAALDAGDVERFDQLAAQRSSDT